MTKHFLKFFMLVTALISVTNSYAYDFEVNGLYYNIVSIDDLTCEVVSGPDGNDYTGSISVPETISVNGKTLTVTRIGSFAFDGDPVSAIKLPNTITYIKSYAFRSCKNLESISFPNGLQYISEYAFNYCEKLNNITIPSSVTLIGESAFRDCSSLSKLVIEDGEQLLTVDKYAFGTNTDSYASGIAPLDYLYLGRNLKIYYNLNQYHNPFCYSPFSTLEIGKYITEIPRNFFIGCSKIKSITIHDSDEPLVFNPNSSEYYSSAFMYSDFENVYIGRNFSYNTIDRISGYPFTNRDCIKCVTFGKKITEVPDIAFRGCIGIEEIYLPENVTSVGINTFAGCSAMKSFTFNNGMTSLGKDFINGTTSLENINANCDIPPTLASKFTDSQYATVKLNVPIGRADAYKDNELWGKFWNINEADLSTITPTVVDNSYEPILYFLLNGLPVNEEPQNGVYIRKQGSSVTKIIK